MNLSGNTRDFPLDVLLRLLADTGKTGELTLRTADGEGALGIAEGRVVAAVFGNEAPVPALGAIFDMHEATFEFTPWNDPPPANLEGDLDTLRRQAEEHKRWLASVREVIPNDRVRFRLSERAAEQGAVTFTADRWRAVLAVNGERDVNELAAHLGIERNAALDMLAGLVRGNVIETMAPPPEPAWQASPPARPQPAVTAPAPPEPVAAPEPAPPAQPAAPERAVSEMWAATPPPAPEAAPEPPAPEASSLADQWAPPAPVEPEPPAPVDDRLAALFGRPASEPAAPEWDKQEADAWVTPPAAPAQPAAPAEPTAPQGDQWAPATPAANRWAPPGAPESPAPPAADPRLAATTPPPAEPASPPANEWAPPPPVVEAPPKRGFFGMFRREEAAPEPATRTTLVDRSATSRAGLLAAFANALIAEYNSGHYGRNRIDDRIASLLMRVDEQADPIDRPLPVVDDRLDVQALERTRLSEEQSGPYLATLVATIYGDAEGAFGRDKAKRGYKAAQQHVFGNDLSALAGPDVAGKLPRI